MTPPASALPPPAAWPRVLLALRQEDGDLLAELEALHVGAGAAERAWAADAALAMGLLDMGAMDAVQPWRERAQAAPPADGTEPLPWLLWRRLGQVARAVFDGAPRPADELAAAWLQALLRRPPPGLAADERLAAALLLLNLELARERYAQFDALASWVEEPAAFARASALMRARWCHAAGWARYQVGRAEAAEHDWQRSLTLAHEAAAPQLALQNTLALVRMQLDAGRSAEAGRTLAAVQPGFGAARGAQLIELQQMRARWHLLEGRAAAAAGHLDDALALAEQAGLPATEQASALTDRVQVWIARGRLDEAQAELARLAAQAGGRDAEVFRCLHELLAAQRAGDDATARPLLEAGLQRAERLRYPMFFRLLPALAAGLCDRALRLGVQGGFVREVLAARRLAAPPQAGADWPWPLWLQLFGGFEIRRDGVPLVIAGRTPHKVLELLRLLGCSRGLSAAAALLEHTLWPEAEADAARKSLEMTVQRLRRLLGDASLVTVADGRVALDATRASSDLLQRRVLLEALEAAAMRPPAATDEAGRHALAVSVERFVATSRGELLPAAPSAPWLEAERETCRRETVRAAGAAAAALARLGDEAAGCELLETALRIEPLAETLALRLAQAHREAGRRAEALRVLERLKADLARAGLTPSAAVQAAWRASVG